VALVLKSKIHSFPSLLPLPLLPPAPVAAAAPTEVFLGEGVGEELGGPEAEEEESMEVNILNGPFFDNFVVVSFLSSMSPPP
jgi:hypothetical protein